MIDQTSVLIRDELRDSIEWLSHYGKTPSGGVRRLLYDSAWRKAQHALAEKWKHMGFSVRFDDVGNLFGRVQGRGTDKQVILTGSHIDTVIDGGKYDGAYGILASMVAVSRLLRKYGTPERSIEVVSLCEEEGSRFPLSFWGSGNLTGKYRPDLAGHIVDSEGISLLKAMQDAGFGLGKYSQPERRDIACFLETHIEQGMTMENRHQVWAPVSYIVGQRRFTITLTGASNHAGTTPMDSRRDTLAAAARMIAGVSRDAAEMTNGLVATVGRIEAEPNTVNVIPGRCRFSLDIRHHQQSVIDQFSHKLNRFFKKTAEQCHVNIQMDQWMDVSPIRLDPQLLALNMKLAEKAGLPCKQMVSGAGHDAQIFGTYCPTALMFVPSHRGISHAPEEFTRPEDLATGVGMLMKLLYQLAWTSEKSGKRVIHNGEKSI